MHPIEIYVESTSLTNTFIIEATELASLGSVREMLLANICSASKVSDKNQNYGPFWLEGSENTVLATTNKISAHFKYAREPCWQLTYFSKFSAPTIAFLAF